MNRAKKEEKRKYQEARKGKTAEEIAVIDAQDIVNEQIHRVAKLLHGSLFSEEYDLMSDSISDAHDRKKGINPMSEEYIKKVDDKRRVLGFSSLSSSGQTTTNDTMEYCLRIAKGALQTEIS